MGWIQRWFGTPTPSVTEQVLLEQTRALAELCHRQQETLDRIVGARFDRPVTPALPQIDNAPPDGLMNDQELPLAAALTVESDEAFIQAANG